MASEARPIIDWLIDETGTEPMPGQRYFSARAVRDQAHLEAGRAEMMARYLMTQANTDQDAPDPENIRLAGGALALREVWQRVEALATEIMDQWREAARAYHVEGGVDDDG